MILSAGLEADDGAREWDVVDGFRARRYESKDRKDSASSTSLWSTTRDTSVCKKFRASTADSSSHISRNLVISG